MSSSTRVLDIMPDVGDTPYVCNHCDERHPMQLGQDRGVVFHASRDAAGLVGIELRLSLEACKASLNSMV